jgi:hypothetical protein
VNEQIKTDPSVMVTEARLLACGSEHVELGIEQTRYRLHLVLRGSIEAESSRRVRGIIRASVWKVDRVSRGGGSFVEPVIGRPRRIQGPVLATVASTNSLVVSICGCRLVGDLPERWQADEFPPGTRVGLDVFEGAVFEPA